MKYAGQNGNQLAKMIGVSSSGISRMYVRGKRVVVIDKKKLDYIVGK